MRALFPMLLVAVVGCESRPSYTAEQIEAAKRDFCRACEDAVDSTGDTVTALAELEAAKAAGDPDSVRLRVMFHEAAKGLEQASKSLRRQREKDLLDMGIEPADVDCRTAGKSQ